MLYCSENRLIPTNINLMVIESDDGMFYYIHRSLYDQAVILSDRFKGKEKELMDLIGRYSGTDDVPECVEFFHLVVPEPVNILGYFLALVDGFETMSQDIEVLCGVIHQMSAALNFRSLISIPMEMRAQARFSLSIETEFRLSWDRFFQEALPYDEDTLLGKNKQTVVYSNNEDEEEEEEQKPFDWGAFMENLEKEEEKEEKDKPVEQVTPVEDEPIMEEVDDGADLIASLI